MMSRDQEKEDPAENTFVFLIVRGNEKFDTE